MCICQYVFKKKKSDVLFPEMRDEGYPPLSVILAKEPLRHDRRMLGWKKAGCSSRIHFRMNRWANREKPWFNIQCISPPAQRTTINDQRTTIKPRTPAKACSSRPYAVGCPGSKSGPGNPSGASVPPGGTFYPRNTCHCAR